MATTRRSAYELPAWDSSDEDEIEKVPPQFHAAGNANAHSYYYPSSTEASPVTRSPSSKVSKAPSSTSAVHGHHQHRPHAGVSKYRDDTDPAAAAAPLKDIYPTYRDVNTIGTADDSDELLLRELLDNNNSTKPQRQHLGVPVSRQRSDSAVSESTVSSSVSDMAQKLLSDHRTFEPLPNNHNSHHRGSVPNKSTNPRNDSHYNSNKSSNNYQKEKHSSSSHSRKHSSTSTSTSSSRLEESEVKGRMHYDDNNDSRRSQSQSQSYYSNANQRPQQSYTRDESVTFTALSPNSHINTTHQPSPSEQPQPHQQSMFATREFLLGVTESIKYLSDYLSRVSDYVEKEGDLEEKMLSTISSLVYRHGGPIAPTVTRSSLSALPKEAYVLQDAQCELDSVSKAAIKAIALCFKVHKETYNSQLRKMRDTANFATRQAIQHERGEFTTAMSRLKESHALERETTFKTLRQEAAELKTANEFLERQLRDTRHELTYFMTLNEQHLGDRERAVQQALKDAAEAFGNEKIQLVKNALAENQKVREDAAHQVELAMASAKGQVETQQRHEEDIKQLLSGERLRLESDNSYLRDQLMQATSQVTLEKEKCALRITEERASHERTLQSLQVEHLKEQSKLKADMQELIKHVRSEELKTKAEIDGILARERDALMTSFAIDLDRKEEKWKNESKRQMATLEVRLQEELVRVRHGHEQEMKRVLRDNDRLAKIVARAGLGSAGNPYYAAAAELNNTTPANSHSTTHSSNSYNINSTNNSGYQSSSTSHHVRFDLNGNNNDNNTDEMPPPPPPPPTTVLSTNAFLNRSNDPTPAPVDITSGQHSRSGWGRLQESLDKQETRLPQNRLNTSSANGALRSPLRSPLRGTLAGSNSSSNINPPDTLPLDEALASAKLGVVTGSGHDVTSSAKKVGQYMSKLQSYIETEFLVDDINAINANRPASLAGMGNTSTMRATDVDKLFQNLDSESEAD